MDKNGIFRYVIGLLLVASISFAADPMTLSAATANGSAYSFGDWASSNVSVTLVCSAGSSNCATTKYCIDAINACDPTAGTVYSAPVNVSTEGTSYIRFASSGSGGWGDAGYGAIKLDFTPPTISISDDASASWTNNDTLSVNANDSSSGIAQVYWITRTDSACGSAQDAALDAGSNASTIYADNDAVFGSKYICFRAKDGAGNRNYAVSAQILRLDSTVPAVNAGADVQSRNPFSQNGAASDAASGISSYSWSQASGPGTLTFGSSSSQATTISASLDGTYVATLEVADAAGNKGSDSFTLVWITSAPAISITNPATTPEKVKFISATTDSGNLEMAITNGTECGSFLPFTQYTSLRFDNESDNGKRVCYAVTDHLGNTGYALSEQIAGIDTTGPVITLNGTPIMDLDVQTTFVDPGANASDGIDGDLTSKITASGAVDSNRTGEYNITYGVSDAAGNMAEPLVRKVNVVDRIKPVITIIGNSTVQVEIKSVFADAGATAMDNYDGDLTSKIVVGGTVDTSKAGEYRLTYDVSDSSGNRADSAVRTVKVVDGTMSAVMGIVTGLVALAVVGAILAGIWLYLQKGKRRGL